MSGMFFLTMIVVNLWHAPITYQYVVRGYPDFSCLYTAGKMLRNGQGQSLYNLAAQTDVQRQFSQVAAERNRALYYMRPPFEAILFVPFAYLSYQRAYFAWLGLNLSLIAIAAFVARRRVPNLINIPAWVYYAAYFAFAPITYGLALGQDTGLVLLLFTIAAVSLIGQRDFLAGCALGLALVKFQLVIPLALVLLLKRRFRCLGGLALVGALLLVLSVMIVGLPELMNYPSYLLQLNQLQTIAAISPQTMPNLRGFVQAWAGPSWPPQVVNSLIAVLAIALLIWVARNWNTKRPGSLPYLGGLALAFVAAVLTGYHTFVHDLSLLCPMLLLSASVGLQCSDLIPSTRRVLLASSAALLCAPLYFIALRYFGRLDVMAIVLLGLSVGWSRAIAQWTTAQPQ